TTEAPNVPAGPVPRLGFPILATNNTTRVDGADAIADAAGGAQAVYPGLTNATRPAAVTIAPTDHWHAGLASAVLMAAPIHAPILLSGPGSLPAVTAHALAALKPRGANSAGGAQAITVGDAPTPGGLHAKAIKGTNDYLLAQAIDTFEST